MEQLNFFDLLATGVGTLPTGEDHKLKELTSPVSKVETRGRKKSIDYSIIFETKKLLSIKRNKPSNKEIIETLKLSRATFYRIKQGYYDKYFKEEMQKHIKNFSLNFTN